MGVWSLQSRFPVLLGVLLGLVGLVGVLQSARFMVSSGIYGWVRYGGCTRESGGELRAVEMAEVAYRLDRGNHHFWAWLADRLATAYEADRNPGMKADAMRWVDRGLAANPYGWRLNVVKAKLLSDMSPSDAVLFWTRYVEWHYWEPFNQAYLAELSARAGDFGNALEVLRRIEGMPYHQQTSQIVMEWIRR
jgi:hypothetical protein